jgi:transcriptional regulator with XRE-family HTH domain
MLGDELRKARHKAGITQEQVAARRAGLLCMFNMLHMESANEESQTSEIVVSYGSSAT